MFVLSNSVLVCAQSGVDLLEPWNWQDYLLSILYIRCDGIALEINRLEFFVGLELIQAMPVTDLIVVYLKGNLFWLRLFWAILDMYLNSPKTLPTLSNVRRFRSLEFCSWRDREFRFLCSSRCFQSFQCHSPTSTTRLNWRDLPDFRSS